MSSSNKSARSFNIVPNNTNILSQSQEYLTTLANSEGFWNVLSTAFDNNYNTERAEILRNQGKTKDFTHLPSIEIVSSDILGGANAAYAASTNQIYLSDAFVATVNTQSVVSALLEEIGHFVDTYINQKDSPGDEGAIYSKLVQISKHLSDETVQGLKAEDETRVSNRYVKPT